MSFCIANNAGNAVGPIANLGILHPKLLLLMGGISIAVGAATYGKKVADTAGKGITPLDIPGAFVAQISSAVGIHFFSVLGIPVSTSSAISPPKSSDSSRWPTTALSSSVIPE